MNLILIDKTDFLTETRVVLGERRTRHIRKVLRSGVGDRLSVGLVNGLCGTGEVVALDRERTVLDLRLDQAPPSPLEVVLVLALPRPKVFRRILRGAVSMGVKEIVLLHSARVEKSYWQTPFLEAAELDRQIRLGLEQAKDTILPEVRVENRFRPFVEDRLPGLLEGRTGYLAHPGEGGRFPKSPASPAVLVVGPEGGFVPFEVDLMTANGLYGFDLGCRILTTETAVPVLLSRFL